MSTSTLDYGFGSIIGYYSTGGSYREVRVTDRDENIKNGRPGFDGTDLATGEMVWGYDSQIVRIVKK